MNSQSSSTPSQKLERFEDMRVWQEARGIVQSMAATTGGNAFGREPLLRELLLRSSLNMMSRIAQSFERYLAAEKTPMLVGAKDASAEIRSLLHVAVDQKCLSEREADGLRERCVTVTKQISGLLRAQSQWGDSRDDRRDEPPPQRGNARSDSRHGSGSRG